MLVCDCRNQDRNRNKVGLYTLLWVFFNFVLSLFTFEGTFAGCDCKNEKCQLQCYCL